MNLETGQLAPGDRVRCIRGTMCSKLVVTGESYTVFKISKMDGWLSFAETGGTEFLPSRFKPIVRVKAPSRPGCCNRGCDGCKDFAFRARLHRFATSGASLP